MKFEVGKTYIYKAVFDKNIPSILIFRVTEVIHDRMVKFEQIKPEPSKYRKFDHFHYGSWMWTRSKLHIESIINKEVDDFIK